MTAQTIQRFGKTFAALLLAALAAGNCRAEDPHPVQWLLTARAAALPLHKGSPVRATLHARILPGWHLYAMDQQPGGPTPTKIAVANNQPFTLSGSIQALAMPLEANDSSFNLETRYFQGEAAFAVPLQTTAPVSTPQAKVTVEVLYQTCNDRMCLPPRVEHVSGAVRVGR